MVEGVGCEEGSEEWRLVLGPQAGLEARGCCHLMKSMQEEGLRLIREAESIFRRDAQGALNDKDYNMVVRRAQEVVELTLKGALKILGIDYPKVHDIAPLFLEQLRQKRGIDDPKVLQRIEEISLWLAQSRTPSFYPPSQKATGVNPWMNAKWVSSVALAEEDTLRHAAHRLWPTGRRVAPTKCVEGATGVSPWGSTLSASMAQKTQGKPFRMGPLLSSR